MSDDVTQIVEVFRPDPDSDDERRVGQLAYAADGMLSVLEADPDIAAQLDEAVRAANGKKEIVELVPPEDAPEKFQTADRVTRRGDEQFFEALGRYLEKYYGFTLG